MPEHSLQLYSVSGIPVTRTADGTSLAGNNPIVNAVNGDAFSWQTPSNVAMTFGSPDASVTFDDADSILDSLQPSGDLVVDQALAQPATIGGTTYQPSPNSYLWQDPPAVYVRSEYSVTLFDGADNEYLMVGVSIVRGYQISVVGVLFPDGAPPPGTTLFYRQGGSSFDPDPELALSVLCFVAGSQILTADGEVAVEDLRPGMLVITQDAGPQPVRWVGRRLLDAIDLQVAPHLRPVRIRRGALGDGALPRRDLLVSPQHRILVRSQIAQRIFGAPEVLAAAGQLLAVDGIETVTDAASVTYVHFVLDRHHIVFAEGAPTESLYPGPEALKSVGRAARQELLALFPELRDPGFRAEAARPLAPGRQARALAERHWRNGRDLL